MSTQADLDAALARLAEAKSTYAASDQGPEASAVYRAVKNEVNAIRVAFKQAEEAAGRRAGRVGGDVTQTGG